MARVSFIEEKEHPELAEVIARIRGNRGGNLVNFYKVLLHSPALVLSWLGQAAAVRSKTDIDSLTRELVIMRVALLNRDDYVLKTHVEQYAPAEGVTDAQCQALVDWRRSDLFSAPQCAALAYADAITRDIQVPDAVFEEVRRHYTERQAVELTVLTATYNMHTRVLQALRIDA